MEIYSREAILQYDNRLVSDVWVSAQKQDLLISAKAALNKEIGFLKENLYSIFDASKDKDHLPPPNEKLCILYNNLDDEGFPCAYLYHSITKQKYCYSVQIRTHILN